MNRLRAVAAGRDQRVLPAAATGGDEGRRVNVRPCSPSRYEGEGTAP